MVGFRGCHLSMCAAGSRPIRFAAVPRTRRSGFDQVSFRRRLLFPTRLVSPCRCIAWLTTEHHAMIPALSLSIATFVHYSPLHFLRARTTADMSLGCLQSIAADLGLSSRSYKSLIRGGPLRRCKPQTPHAVADHQPPQIAMGAEKFRVTCARAFCLADGMACPVDHRASGSGRQSRGETLRSIARSSNVSAVAIQRLISER
jgi:hypothetical protein